MFAPYRLLHTLTKGHTNSVNCVAFCHDGDHLATGGDDCKLIIWNVTRGIAQYIIELNSPVLAILWDPRWHSTLICGCEDGNAVVLSNFHVSRLVFITVLMTYASQSKHPGHTVLLGIRAPVYCLALETFSGSLAIGVGPEVHIAKQIVTSKCTFMIYLRLCKTLTDIEQYATSVILPRPRVQAKFSEQLEADSPVRPRGVHFLKKGTLLIVSYLNHGIM